MSGIIGQCCASGALPGQQYRTFSPAGSILSDLSGEPLSLDTLQLLLLRESAQEPPQYYIQQWHGRGAVQTERRLSHFPHPFPTLKDLEKEILRSVLHAARLRWANRAPCGCRSEAASRVFLCLFPYRAVPCMLLFIRLRAQQVRC